MLFLGILSLASFSVFGVLSCTENTKNLPDLERRSRVYRNEGFDPLVNDVYLNDGWYFVNNHVGQYAMPDKVPTHGTCGTNNPIYLQDTHPDMSVLSETPIDVIACMVDDFGDCGYTLTIKIRLCNGVLSYYLVTTNQPSAYCFDPPELQDILDIPPAPEGVDLGQINVVPALKFKDIDKDDRVEFFPYLEFECSFTFEPPYFYSVTWYCEGRHIADYGPSTNIADLKLLEEVLLQEKMSLGINIVCGVRVSIDKNGMRTKMETSAEFFAGLKVTNPFITLDKSKSTDIELVQTVPIGCHYTSVSDSECFTRLSMTDPRQYQCLEGNIVSESHTQRCGIDLPAVKKFEDWKRNESKHTFKITTKDENHEDRTQYKLHLTTGRRGHQIWREYEIGEIQVQERLIRCNQNLAWCACALGVRAGADVFIINLCQGSVRFINFKTCEDGGTMTVVEKTPTHYEIYTAIGTRIEAVFHASSTIMNIDITMAPKDIGHTEGLCGDVDGKQSNDFRKRDKTLTDSQSFAIDWRLKNRENVFKQTNFKRWADVNSLFCVCEQAFENGEGYPSEAAVCSLSLDLECKRKNGDKKKCLKQSRKRRSISDKMTREIERKMNKKIPFEETYKDKRAAISESDAIYYCKDMINNSLAFNEYKDQTANEDPDAVISQCVFDVTAAGDLKYASYHLDALNSIVSKSFELVPGYVANNTEKVSFFKQNSCLNNCSYQGRCNEEGICECSMFYHGSECEIDERVALQIVDAEGGGVCDIQDGDGCSCLSVSTTNLLENFTCEIGGEITFDNNTTEPIAPSKIIGLQQDMFTGICCISENERKRRSTVNNHIFAVRYDISISNNGENFSNSESIVVLDSECQWYTLGDGIPKAYLKTGYCFIDGLCMRTLTSQDLNECYICNPEANTGNWTYVCVQTSNHTNKAGVIIGTTVGVGSAIILIIISFVTWKYSGSILT